jgi:hypothetical protein
MAVSEAVADSTPTDSGGSRFAIFADQGFEAESVREICQNAGSTNVASVKYHLGDKRRLYEVCSEEARPFIGCLISHAGHRPPHARSGASGAIFGGDSIRFLASDPFSWEGRLILREMLQPSAVGRPLLEQGVRPQFEFMGNLDSGNGPDGFGC